jgi:hypothetical protein
MWRVYIKVWRALQVSSTVTLVFAAMNVSPPDDPMSIFADGKLRSGVYRIQNLYCQTYLEILEHSKELCCRPATALSPQDALVNLDVLLIFEWSGFLTLYSGSFGR